MSGHECPECGFQPLEEKKSIEDNEVVVGGWYCPDCGKDYSEDTKFDWDDVDFPVWIHWESYNDTWGMRRHFLDKTGLHPDVAGHPQEMKYTVFTVWFKIEEGGAVVGPYDEKNGELI